MSSSSAPHCLALAGAEAPRLAHLLGRGVVVDFGIVAETWSVFVHGRSRRADKFG